MYDSARLMYAGKREHCMISTFGSDQDFLFRVRNTATLGNYSLQEGARSSRRPSCILFPCPFHATISRGADIPLIVIPAVDRSHRIAVPSHSHSSPPLSGINYRSDESGWIPFSRRRSCHCTSTTSFDDDETDTEPTPRRAECA